MAGYHFLPEFKSVAEHKSDSTVAAVGLWLLPTNYLMTPNQPIQ